MSGGHICSTAFWGLLCFFFFLNFDHYRKAEDSEEGEKHLSMLKCEKKSLENLVRSSFWK